MKEYFAQKTTRYLDRLAETSSAVRMMYFFDPKYENIPADLGRDLLLEKKFTPVKGIVHKFGSRALFLLSYTCAANCRFCERQDRVGIGIDKYGFLKPADIQNAVAYIAASPGINEVIFSGGDPLTNPEGLLLACQLLKKVPHVKIFRLHTRFPLQFPQKTDIKILKIIADIPQVSYLSVHVNHPDELNDITLPVLADLRKAGFILLAQTVFLKGVNDNIEVLEHLFRLLSEHGIRPYYIYHCQSIPTTSRFVMDIDDEVSIMTMLRERLSGIAFPNHVVDLQGTIGKVVVPSNHWVWNRDIVFDYLGKGIGLADYDKYKLDGNRAIFGSDCNTAGTNNKGAVRPA